MRDYLTEFVQHFFDNSREIKGLRARFCLREDLKLWCFFVGINLWLASLFLGVRSEKVKDPVGGRDGYVIKTSAFKSLNIK